ncbi:MAG TPA: hypothetical protein DHV48_02770 [Prolixibacteraceae bacterium]|nr:hypothetical protein [Prolixibacteraceae bacterium]
MELTKNGINCTNIKKVFPEIQIHDLRKRLIYRAKQRVLDKKPSLQTFAGNAKKIEIFNYFSFGRTHMLLNQVRHLVAETVLFMFYESC